MPFEPRTKALLLLRRPHNADGGRSGGRADQANLVYGKNAPLKKLTKTREMPPSLLATVTVLLKLFHILKLHFS